MRYFKMITLLFVLPIIISSCGFNAWKGKIPTGDWSGPWSKVGISELEVKKAELECGYEQSLSELEPSADKDYPVSFRCMQKSGFTYYDNKHDACEYYPKLRYICDLPLSQVPDRDINKRLNSLHCKKYAPDAPECQP